jgi:FtsP/CotA-like multicopper oxidase with cupredoxin domain
MQMSRRAFVTAALASGLAVAAGCGRSTSVAIPNDRIGAVEAARPHTGRTVAAELNPQRAQIDLGGVNAATFAYGDSLPGPVIRASVGDELAVTVKNGLSHSTSVHWHGISLRNDMDGAAPASPDIPAGTDFVYRFSVPHPGTYWAHPHTGLDADTGLYVPVIVDDPAEPGAYDAEWIVVLDDWTDGIGSTPQQIYDGLRGSSMAHGNMPGMGDMPGMGQSSGMEGERSSTLLGGDAGDVSYPYYVINGRIPAAPTTFAARPGQRLRIRIINAGSDTAFRVALAGHRMTVTHTDGFPVHPIDVDALLVGMGERYDVIVTAGDGVFPLVAHGGRQGRSGARIAVHWGRKATRCRVSPARTQPAGGDGRLVQCHTRSRLGNCQARHYADGGVDRRHDGLRLDDQRTAIRRQAAAHRAGGSASKPHVLQHVDDVASDASARPHLPSGQIRWQSGPAQGHRHRSADAKADR